MALTTYTELQAAIADWLNRTDITTQIADFTTLEEKKIYRSLRVRDMESALSVTMSSGVAALPTDFLELKHAYIDGSPVKTLERKSITDLYEKYPTRSSHGKPNFIASNVDNFEFAPFPDSDYTVKGTYWARPTALSASNETNFLITNYPDLILFGSLLQSISFTGDTTRLSEWAAKYDNALEEIKTEEKQQRYGGSSLRSVSR